MTAQRLLPPCVQVIACQQPRLHLAPCRIASLALGIGTLLFALTADDTCTLVGLRAASIRQALK
jgi:hypothetical protein